MSREESPIELVVPENIHDILSNSLIPAEELNVRHRNTEKYYVDGFPELFVRLNRGEVSLSEIQTSIEGIQRLREQRINVLPAQVVEHEGEAYVITKRVMGIDLRQELVGATDAVLLREVDQLWCGLSRNLMKSRKEGRSVASDIEGAHQYMRGCIEGDNITRVWLVDLPIYCWDITDEEYFAAQVLNNASGIVEIEKLTGQDMLRAREAVGQALTLIESNTSWAGKLRRAAQYVLHCYTELSPEGDDELIDEMF